MDAARIKPNQSVQPMPGSRLRKCEHHWLGMAAFSVRQKCHDQAAKIPCEHFAREVGAQHRSGIPSLDDPLFLRI
jgi:hypothetical protein